MDLPKDLAECFEIGHMNQQVIVIGQDDPGVYLHSTLNKLLEQGVQDAISALRRMQVMPVLVAGGREKIEGVIKSKMWGLMRRMPLRLSFLHQLLALLQCEFAVFIHGVILPHTIAT